MDKNKSHVCVILDRSGSMSNIAADMEGGLNKLIQDQKNLPGECLFSFYKFDNRVEREYFFADIKSVGSIRLQPRGSTALNDAIAQAILETGNYLAKLQENDRPALVTMVIVTDGEENSSVEYKDTNKIKQMINEQTSKYNWHFNYLGANQDSFVVSANLGICNVANYIPNKAGSVMRNYSSKLSEARTSTSESRSVDLQYNYQDQKDLN